MIRTQNALQVIVEDWVRRTVDGLDERRVECPPRTARALAYAVDLLAVWEGEHDTIDPPPDESAAVLLKRILFDWVQRVVGELDQKGIYPAPWNTARALALAAGMIARLDGDTEPLTEPPEMDF